MSQFAPYQGYPPPHNAPPGFEQAGAETHQATILEALKGTKPWVTFLSILGFLGSGLIVLLGLVTLIAGSALATLGKGPFEKFAPLFGLFYIVVGGFYFVPSLLVWQYSASIGQHVASGGTMETLARAVERQKSIWRFMGISMVVLIGFYIVAIFVGIVAGVMSAVARP